MSLTSRERVIKALNHQEADKVPYDMGSSAVTGIHASSVYKLRQALKLDEPGTPVKVIEPYQMLGEVKDDLIDALNIDVVGVGMPQTLFGFKNENWKPWTTFDGTPVLVPDAFNTEVEPDGNLLMYPEGDKNAPPSGRMPAGGFYFDTIIRQPEIDDANLNVEDNLEEFGPIADEDLHYLVTEIDKFVSHSDKAILANFGGTAFGDIALVPAPWLKKPKGIRDVAEWYISTASRRDYVYEVFNRQCEIALGNLQKIFSEVGNRVQAVFTTGTDFGTQNGPFISPRAYRDLFKPFHKRINDWIHTHTTWKIFIHTCGSVSAFLPDFIDAGFDILNPVQTSAANMDPITLKQSFGQQITFWGGGIDTQKTLPYGSPQEIRMQVKENIAIFGKDGGFIFNTIHNIQPGIPTENLLALVNAVQEFRSYN